MKDISSIVLIIFAILSFGIRLFKKANLQPESERPTPMKKDLDPISSNQEEESDLPQPKPYEASPITMSEKPRKETVKRLKKTENPSIPDDFDLAKAVIYSEILKPRTFDEE